MKNTDILPRINSWGSIPLPVSSGLRTTDGYTESQTPSVSGSPIPKNRLDVQSAVFNSSEFRALSVVLLFWIEALVSERDSVRSVLSPLTSFKDLELTQNSIHLCSSRLKNLTPFIPPLKMVGFLATTCKRIKNR